MTQRLIGGVVRLSACSTGHASFILGSIRETPEKGDPFKP